MSLYKVVPLLFQFKLAAIKGSILEVIFDAHQHPDPLTVVVMGPVASQKRKVAMEISTAMQELGIQMPVSHPAQETRVRHHALFEKQLAGKSPLVVVNCALKPQNLSSNGRLKNVVVTLPLALEKVVNSAKYFMEHRGKCPNIIDPETQKEYTFLDYAFRIAKQKFLAWRELAFSYPPGVNGQQKAKLNKFIDNVIILARASQEQILTWDATHAFQTGLSRPGMSGDAVLSEHGEGVVFEKLESAIKIGCDYLAQGISLHYLSYTESIQAQGTTHTPA